LKSDKHGNATVIKIKGRMDALTAPEFEKESAKWIDQGDINLIVDLGELEYISSAGLRSILVTAKKLKSNKGRISFCCPSGMVMKVFSMSGFSSMFSMYDSLDEALTKVCWFDYGHSYSSSKA
jgi:anti-sigma B factor antagonist